MSSSVKGWKREPALRRLFSALQQYSGRGLLGWGLAERCDIPQHPQRWRDEMKRCCCCSPQKSTDVEPYMERWCTNSAGTARLKIEIRNEINKWNLCHFVNSCRHSFIYSSIHAFIHLFIIQLVICPFIHLSIHSFVHLFIHLPIHFIHSFIRSFNHSIIQLFIRVLIQVLIL